MRSSDSRVAQLAIAFTNAGNPTFGAVRARQQQQARLMFDVVDLAGSAGGAVSFLADKHFAGIDNEKIRCVYRLRRFPRAILPRYARGDVCRSTKKGPRSVEIGCGTVEASCHSKAQGVTELSSKQPPNCWCPAPSVDRVFASGGARVHGPEIVGPLVEVGRVCVVLLLGIAISRDSAEARPHRHRWLRCSRLDSVPPFRTLPRRHRKLPYVR
jgi:hypothetical protein